MTVLKLADRLEVMRSLKMFPKANREQKILETLLLYIPLAHQLGLYNMKREMEDIYLKYAEPEQYRLITNKLKAGEKDREKLMQEFIEPLKGKLDGAGIKYKLKVRTKSAYSIWQKMQKQKVPFEGVYDVFAIRFIIDCDGEDHKLEKDLKVFGFVTEEYEQDTKRLRDWVTNPKPNGYESLHITVKNREGAYIEVQIRTHRMDDMAENGFASHWAYKGIKREESLDKWLTNVRFALEHPDTGLHRQSIVSGVGVLALTAQSLILPLAYIQTSALTAWEPRSMARPFPSVKSCIPEMWWKSRPAKTSVQTRTGWAGW